MANAISAKCAGASTEESPGSDFPTGGRPTVGFVGTGISPVIKGVVTRVSTSEVGTFSRPVRSGKGTGVGIEVGLDAGLGVTVGWA